jgi:hypothetical protein
VAIDRTARPQGRGPADDVIRWHLSSADAEGKPFVAGVYPLPSDDGCWFVAIDFDKTCWREDAAACLDVCRHLALPAARLQRAVTQLRAIADRGHLRASSPAKATGPASASALLPWCRWPA